MATVLATAMRAQIMLARPILKNMDIEAERKAQDALGVLGSKALADRVDYIPEPFENFEAEWAIPRDKGECAVLYLHGGSYTAGCLPYARGFGGVLADATKRSTLCIGYRLAPEYPHPAALVDAEAAYRRVLENFPPDKIAVIGESAGGGLTFSLMLRIKQAGLPMPCRIVALSPWVDLTCSNLTYKTNVTLDPCLFEDALKYSASLYSKGDTANPFVSPLFGDLSGLPPTMIFAGSHELLLGDSIMMAEKLKSAGVNCSFFVEDGMWHVYVLFPIPEAKEALMKITRFLDDCQSKE